MFTCSLPDIYTLSPQALGVYIRQTAHAHGITIRYVFGELRLILNTVEINMISLSTSCLCSYGLLIHIIPSKYYCGKPEQVPH